MINTCAKCGEYAIKKSIDIERSIVTCPFCKHEHPFIFKSLLIVTGPNGGGKSTVCQDLMGNIPNVILLDGDIIWNDYFNNPASNYKEYFETWLRICKNLHQSKVNVVVFNSGMGVPHNITPCEESIYFESIKYLNLTCNEELLVNRLKQRPTWRESANEDNLKDQISFKRWLDQTHAANTIDTSHLSIAQTSNLVKEWIINNAD